MLERLTKQLKEERDSKAYHLTRGMPKDYTEYKTLAAEIVLLSRIIDDIEKLSVEDEDA